MIFSVKNSLSLEQSAAVHMAECRKSLKDIQESIYNIEELSVRLGIK